jgi:hypothetical protein
LYSSLAQALYSPFLKKTDQIKCSWADKQENLNEEAKIKKKVKRGKNQRGKNNGRGWLFVKPLPFCRRNI